MEENRDLTVLLNHWTEGDQQAGERLMELIYGQLKRISRSQLGHHGGTVTLQPTDLVNEAFLRLAGQHSTSWSNRAQFFALSATVMRRILLDHARRRHAQRRDRRVEIRIASDQGLMAPERAAELLELDQALIELAELDGRKARIVEMRYFGGLTVEESAEILEISPATVKREWSVARAWLYRRLRGANSGDG